MVTINLVDGSAERLARVAQIMPECTRIYDVVGYLDRRRVAVLLPETTGQGAWTFADKAATRCAQEDLRIQCEVFSYPLDWSDDTPDNESRGAGSMAHDGDSSGATSISTEHEDQPEMALESSTDHGDSNPPSSSDLDEGRLETRPVQDFGLAFLLDPLPWWKRSIDIVVSLSVLIAGCVPGMIVALLIKSDSRGPVLFGQTRSGLGGRKFTFYKFRSMHEDAEARLESLKDRNIHLEGPIFKDPNDPRITRMGKFIRKWSIDELPQFWNVLRGDMTLVGPRPPKTNEVAEYERWQRGRLEVTGGLTGIWQVSGRSDVGFKDMVRMDLRYKARRSPLLDLKLILRTPFAVFSGKGAY